jgi:hypothetical protein
VLRRAAVAALATAALAVAVPAVAPAQSPASGVRGSFDPAASGRALAFTHADATGAGGVVVRAPGRPPAAFPDGRSPSLDRDLLAYADAAGLRVVRWTTGEEVARLPGPLAKPALDWPWIAYVRGGAAGGGRLELRNLVSGAVRRVARASRVADLGRPALAGGLVAWHVAAGRRSLLRVGPVSGRGSRVVATSVTGLQINPSLSSGRILWVEHTGSRSALRLRRVGGGPVRTLATLRGPRKILWTTALGPRRAYATRWNPTARRAEIVSRAWRR